MPSTTPGEMERRRDLGLHISECHRGECNGFHGPYERYLCICWCHAIKGTLLSEAHTGKPLPY